MDYFQLFQWQINNVQSQSKFEVKKQSTLIFKWLFDSDSDCKQSSSSGFSLFDKEECEDTDSTMDTKNTTIHNNFGEIIKNFKNADYKQHFNLRRSTAEFLIDRYHRN